MKRALVLTILVLFVLPLVFVQNVHAEPLERFAENPIPYWWDRSVAVDIDWQSSDQTVTFTNNSDVDREDWGGSVWTESFTDVSDWTYYSPDGSDAISTDGDVMTMVNDWAGGTDTDYIYTNTPNGTYPYYEVRYRLNDSTVGSVILATYSVDSLGGSNTMYQGLTKTTSWTTFKIYDADSIECIALILQTSAVSGDAELLVDYVRAGPEDELEPKLDVGVPLEIGITQSIEFMGNFSALNSTIRFQMYDNITASGLWCDVNNSIVTFPDASYAEFTNIARINFSLDEERILFKIYVFAQNMTLINSYEDYVGLANNDYLWMTGLAFQGPYELWYLQGDVGYLEGVEDVTNIFYLLFLSTELWGYFGPVGLVIIGWLLTKKEKPLGIFMIIVDSLVIAQYLALVAVTPDYWWHIIILLLGVIQCVFRTVSR